MSGARHEGIEGFSWDQITETRDHQSARTAITWPLAGVSRKGQPAQQNVSADPLAVPIAAAVALV